MNVLKFNNVSRFSPLSKSNFPPSYHHISVLSSQYGYSTESSNRQKKLYSERRLLGYSREQMFKVVSNVEDYHQFVPWCTKSEITQTLGPDKFTCLVTVGFPPVSEVYASTVTFINPSLVKSVAVDGNLFKRLVTIWRFRPGLPNNDKTCILEFSVDFEFKNAFYSNLSSVFFDTVVNHNVKAFMKRARVLYGPQSIEEQAPKVLAYKNK